MKMVKQWLARRMSKGISPRPGVAGSPLLMALEPRVVYDASVAAVAAQPPGAEPAAGVAHHSDPLADPALKDPGSPPSGSAAPDRAADATPPAVVQHAGRPAGNDGTQAGEKSQQAEAPAAGLSSQVVFIDPSIGNYQALIDGLPAGTQYVLLDASTDGFAQIAQYLTSHQGIESISLLSHGEDGAIQAGSAWLTAASLESFRAQLTQIGAAMKPGGDFLIYGCDVAQQADGQWLVQQIADISHLNVAASIDDTGAAALGGDWTLEYEVGAVHPTLNDPAGAYAEFDGLLGVIPTVRDPWLPSIDIGGGGVTWTSADAGAGTGGQPIVVAPGLVMSDSNGYNLISVTVQISGGFQAGDVLSCTDEGGVSVTFNTSSGILSIEGDSGVSVDRLQSVLRSVTFSSTGAGLTSSGATRTISFSFNDGYDSSNVATQTISLVASRQSPVLVESGASSSVYVLGNGGAPVVDSIHISDADDTTLQSATVKITSGLQPGDLLVLSGAVVGESGLTTTYQTNSGNLTLTANGALSLEQWQTVLSAVQFMAGSSNAAGTRTISFSVNDGERNSKEVVYSIDVISAAPAIGSSSSGSVAFVSADNPASSSVVVDPSLTVTSVSNSVTSATIAITGNLHTGEDVLSFINDGSTMGDIRSLYNTLTGVLTLSSDGGIATLAQWQAALRAVTYTDTAITPNTATRTISFTVSDGSTSSAAVTRDVTVSLAEQSPVLVSGNGSVASFVAADNGPSPGIAVDDSIVVSDYDSSTLLSATVTIGAGFQQSEDILGFTPNPITMGNILAVYNNATGVLALISADGSATLAQWQAALRSVTYTNVAVTPNTATRTISFTVSDGSTWSQALSRDVAVSATDQTPILSSGNSGAASFVAGNNAPSTAVAVDDGIVVSDLDSSTLVSATVTIGAGFQPGEDTLSFANDGVTMGNIEASYNAFTGVLSLSSAGGSATLAQWQTALRAVTYTDKAATPNTATRTISFTVDDGIKTSSTLTRDVTVTATDQAPIISSGNSGSASFVAGDNSAGAPMVIDDQITVTDRDSSTLGWASVSIGAGFRSGEDFLSFVNDGATMGSILGVYNASTGVLSLTSAGGTATLAQWQAALRSVKYIDAAATPTTATRTISFTVSDGSNTSTALTRDVTVTATDQTPVIRSGSSGSASFVSGDNAQSTPIVVDGGIVLSDLDNTTLGSASVIVGSGFQPGEDVLGFVNDGATMGNISASYNAFTGVLTLTSAGGTATLAQWQAALRSVTYTDTAVTPNAATRTISFTVNDGVKTSTALTRDVTVTATNQTPVIGSANSDSTSFVAGDNAPSAPVVVDNGIVLSDMDDATLAFATVAIGAGFAPGEDSLGFVNDGATMGNISGSYNAATGVLTLNSAGGTATLAQWQAALRSVTYSDTVTIPSTVTRAIAFQVSDGTGISAAHMRDVTVTATDQAPVLSLSSNGSVSFVAGDNAPGTPVVIDAGITVIDLDNISLYSATVRIDGNFHSGEDSLGFAYRDTMGNISASYDAVTGVLTLTSADGTATLAQWQAALRAVTYSNSLVTDTATRTISITVNDGIKSSAPVTRDIAISVPEQTPQLSTSNSGSTSFVAGDNSAAAPIVIDDQITVTDRDSSTLQWALVTIRAGFRPGEDILSFVNDGATMGSIMGIYNAAAGELMLTSADGTATLAQWQAALRSVTYTDTAATPTTATRTVSFAVSDGVKTSTAVTRDVTVTATDQTPVISSGSSGSASFVSGDNAQSTPIVVDGGIVLSDLDNATLNTATVQIGTGFQSGEDVLGFVPNASTMGNITGSYNAATGVLTLISAGGTATLAQWQSALRSVTYTDTAVTPNAATRTISFTVNDGVKTSTALTRDVTVTATDQTPIISSGNRGSVSFVSGDNALSTPIVVDGGIVLSDLDNATLASATVSIGSGFQPGEDVLGFVNDGVTMGNIAASYNAFTGVLTLSSAGGTATLAQWQAALRSVTYTDTAVTPDAATRTISFTVDDGVKTSTAVTRDVTVTVTDQTPIISSGNSGSVSFVSGDNAQSTPIVVDGGIVLSDLDNATLASATVSIGSGFQWGEDVLSFVNNGATMGNIVGSYNAATGVLTLTSAGGTATLAQWQAALRSVTYTDTAVTPDAATRTISFTVDDGIKTSTALTRDVTVTTTDQTPIISSGNSGSASFVSGDNVQSTPIVVDNGIVLSDLDNATLNTATVQIGAGFQPGEDVLGFVNDGATMGNITGSYNAFTGVLTLTSAGGTATLAQWQAALRSVTYTDTAVTPDAATRTISFTVDDGIKTSTALTRNVTVTATDQTPIISSGNSGSVSFVSGDNAQSTPIVVDNGIVLSDLDNATLNTATVQIGAGFQPGEDVLGFVNDGATMGNITGSYNAFTGVLTLSSAGGTATLAQWQAALRSVTYTDTAVTPDAATRTISFTVDDGIKTSTALTRNVTVTATDQTPIISSGNSGSVSFVSGDNAQSTPVVVDDGIVLSDLDNTTLASATVSIGSGFQSGEDVLSFVNNGATMGNIIGSYNAATGVLTLTSAGGTASLAQWQAALRSVTYTDTAATPTTATRTVSFAVSDGVKTSTAVTRDVTVTATDQTPIISSGNRGSVSFVSGDNAQSTPIVVDNGIVLSDLDNATLNTATVQIGAGFQPGEDVLGFVNDGATMGNITASYNAFTGVLTLTSAGGTATLAQWQAALRSVTYTDTAVTPDAATRTISFTVDDGIKTSTALTRDVTVTATDQTPIISSGNSGSASFVSGDNAQSTPVVVDNGIVLSDLDNATLNTATVQIGAGFQPGEDVLGFVNDGATMGNITASYNAFTGVLTLTSAGGTATLAQWQAALRSVTYTDTAVTPDAATRTISFTVDDGIKTSTALTRDVTVTATDQTPIISSGNSGSASFVSGDNAQSTPVVVDDGIVLSDLDNTTLASATVSIGSGFQSGEDVLSFVNNGATMGNIIGSYNAATGVLTLTSAGGTASLAQWQAALRSVTYTDTAVTPSGAARSVLFVINDGQKSSATLLRDVAITATHQTPLLSDDGRAVIYTADGKVSSAVLVGAGITLTDLNATPPTSATVAFAGQFDALHDVLGLLADAATGDIVARYDAARGVLTLTSASGTASLAQWQAALAALTYRDTQAESVAAARTLVFTVSNGDRTSAVLSRTVQVVAGTSPVGVPILGAAGMQAAIPGAVSGPDGQRALNTTDIDGRYDPVSSPIIVMDAHEQGLGIGTILPPVLYTFSVEGARDNRLGQTQVPALGALMADHVVSPPRSETMPRAEVRPLRETDNGFALSIASLLRAPQARADAVSVSVSLADGARLPAWLHFDAELGMLTGKPPVGLNEVRLLLIGTDAAGNTVSREIIVKLDGSGVNAVPAQRPQAGASSAPPPGKSSLATQFANALAMLHVSRDHVAHGDLPHVQHVAATPNEHRS